MQIYVAEGTQHTGPFDLETIKAGLRAGRYQPGQLAWYDGAPGWEPISRLPGMEGFNAPPPATPAPASYQAPPPGYQPPYQGPGSAPYYAPAPGGTRGRPWGWIVAGIVVALAVLSGGIFATGRYGHTARGAGGSPAPGVVTAPATAAPPIVPATPDTVPVAPAVPGTSSRHYVSNRARYSGNSATHFIAFSFDYPADWKLDENVNDEFVEAQRYLRAPNGKDVVVESISFSYAFSRPGYSLAANLPLVGTQLLEMAATSLTGRFPGATKTDARPGRFGRYTAQEHFLTSPADANDPSIYFRQAIVARPNSSGTDGLFVTLLGSDPAGSQDAETLGKSGGLRTIEDSFRFEPQ